MENLPVLNIENDRILKGTLLKFVDGRWADRGGTALKPDMHLLVLATGRALQRWADKIPVETIVRRPDVELPDLDELNRKVPRAEWELGLDGNPRPPWVKQYLVYLLNIGDASVFTYANGTVGSRLAVHALEDRLQWMRALRGSEVLPLIKLTDRPLKTRYGEKRRPEFEVLGWRQFSSGAALQIADQSAANLKTLEPLSLGDEMRDEIPYR
jgi:hypothetical protein